MNAERVAKRKVKGCNVLYIFDPIYRANVWVCYSTDFEKFRKYIRDRFNFEVGPEGSCDGRTVIMDDINTFPIWLRHKINHVIMSHEIIHVALEIFRRKGIEVSSDSEEAFTYYHDYLMRTVIRGI